MANYAYVRRIKPSLTLTTFHTHVVLAVRALFKERLVVRWAEFDFDGPTLLVLPTGSKNDEDDSFVVSLKDANTIAFRHSPMAHPVRWAQGCLEEELSERLKAPLYFDAGPTIYPPGRRWYRDREAPP